MFAQVRDRLPRPVNKPPGTKVDIAEVPVGGGLILTNGPYVVTQPAAGVFHAFRKNCTHQMRPVNEVTSEGIHCPAHGSVFALSDGYPLCGPGDDDGGLCGASVAEPRLLRSLDAEPLLNRWGVVARGAPSRRFCVGPHGHGPQSVAGEASRLRLIQLCCLRSGHRLAARKPAATACASVEKHASGLVSL